MGEHLMIATPCEGVARQGVAVTANHCHTTPPYIGGGVVWRGTGVRASGCGKAPAPVPQDDRPGESGA